MSREGSLYHAPELHRPAKHRGPEQALEELVQTHLFDHWVDHSRMSLLGCYQVDHPAQNWVRGLETDDNKVAATNFSPTPRGEGGVRCSSTAQKAHALLVRRTLAMPAAVACVFATLLLHSSDPNRLPDHADR